MGGGDLCICMCTVRRATENSCFGNECNRTTISGLRKIRQLPVVLKNEALHKARNSTVYWTFMYCTYSKPRLEASFSEKDSKLEQKSIYFNKKIQHIYINIINYNFGSYTGKSI
jgi:hypothetical protein